MPPKRPARKPAAIVTNGDVIALPAWFVRLVVGVLVGGALSTFAWANNLNIKTAQQETNVNNLIYQLNRMETKLDALMLRMPKEP